MAGRKVELMTEINPGPVLLICENCGQQWHDVHTCATLNQTAVAIKNLQKSVDALVVRLDTIIERLTK